MSIPGLGEKKTTVETATGSEVRVDSVDSAGRPLGTPDAATAYEQGRADALRADAAAAERERERERTRAQPRRRGGGLGLIGLLVLLLAIIGGVFLFLSWRHGSLQGGGAAMGNGVSAATEPAKEAGANLRNATGQAVENAGEALKSSGEKIKKP